MQRRVRIAIVVMGFSGLVAEVLLLRELMIAFAGIELSIGIILANWLILEAAGCLTLGRIADKTRYKLEAYTIIAVLFSAAFIAAIFFTRILKNLLGVSIGENVELIPMFYSSFLILLPVCFLHGALFTIGCRIYAMFSVMDASSTGKVYVYETIGTVLGGIICTFLLIPLLHTFEAAFGIALLIIITCLFLMSPFGAHRIEQTDSPRALTRVMPVGLIVLLLLTGYALIGGTTDNIHNRSIDMQWKNHNVVHYENSRYNNISVVERDGQYLFFLDGIRELITPEPDIQFVEEFVHLPLLAHPNPRDVLILRGGAGGIINEVLQHPSIRSVEYAEHDPLLIDIIRKHPTPLTESELNDERVHLEHTDGRLYLSKTSGRYDVIFIGVMVPSNLQANRFYTHEFYQLAKKRLNDGGILVIGAPGSLTYMSDEIKNLNSNIFHTLKSVFSHVRVSPGDSKHIYLSSDSEDIMRLDLMEMMDRLERRGILAESMVPWDIEKKLHAGWQQWFQDYIDGMTTDINYDFRPVGMFYHIAHWNSLHAPGFGKYFNQLDRAGLNVVIPVLLIVLMLHFLYRLATGRYARAAIPIAIFTSGFAGMIFSLVVIFMFQITYGHVFSWVGLLVAAFMAGAGIGAMYITRIMGDLPSGKRPFLYFEAAIIAFAIALPLIFLAGRALPDTQTSLLFVRILFLAVAFVSGLLVGAQFPLANKLYLNNPDGLSKTAGLIYGSDLLGGWLGGIVGGVLLIPVMGLTGTCITVAMVKLTSFIMVASVPGAAWGSIVTNTKT
ncbi:hypothetical protein QA596_07905 [Balneolales bacterium ANBcel1]|nr:hypothetical protein [Balneolales bacterium ANBcel1]